MQTLDPTQVVALLETPLTDQLRKRFLEVTDTMPWPEVMALSWEMFHDLCQAHHADEALCFAQIADLLGLCAWHRSRQVMRKRGIDVDAHEGGTPCVH